MHGSRSSCLGGSAAATLTATTATTSTSQIDCQIARNSYVRVCVCCSYSILAILSPEHGKPFRQQHTSNSGWLMLGGGLAAASYRLLSIGRVACQARNESKRDTFMRECGCLCVSVWHTSCDHTDIQTDMQTYIHTYIPCDLEFSGRTLKNSPHTRTQTHTQTTATIEKLNIVKARQEIY